MTQVTWASQYSTSESEKMPMKWKVFLNIPIFKVHIFPPVKWQGSRAEADTQTGDKQSFLVKQLHFVHSEHSTVNNQGVCVVKYFQNKHFCLDVYNDSMYIESSSIKNKQNIWRSIKSVTLPWCHSAILSWHFCHVVIVVILQLWTSWFPKKSSCLAS